MRTLEQIQIDESCDLIAAQRIQERESNRRLGVVGIGASLLIGAFIASGLMFASGLMYLKVCREADLAKLAPSIAPTHSMSELEYIAFEHGVLRGAIVERKHPSQLDGPAIVKEAFRGSVVEKHIGTNQPFVKVLP